MKKQICVAVITAAISMPTMAEFLGIHAGIDYHTTENSYDAFDFKDSNNLSGYIAVEHFIPLIPNAKIKYSDLGAKYSNSSEQDSYSANAIAYYRIFNNSLFEIDLGLAYTRLDDLAGQTSDIAQAYGAAKVHVPGVGMHFFTELVAGTVTDDEATDAEIGVAYTFNPDALLLKFSVRGGYRYQEMVINDNTQENKGLFAGLEARF